jgi:hypothetical protein
LGSRIKEEANSSALYRGYSWEAGFGFRGCLPAS